MTTVCECGNWMLPGRNLTCCSARHDRQKTFKRWLFWEESLFIKKKKKRPCGLRVLWQRGDLIKNDCTFLWFNDHIIKKSKCVFDGSVTRRFISKINEWFIYLFFCGYFLWNEQKAEQFASFTRFDPLHWSGPACVPLSRTEPCTEGWSDETCGRMDRLVLSVPRSAALRKIPTPPHAPPGCSLPFNPPRSRCPFAREESSWSTTSACLRFVSWGSLPGRSSPLRFLTTSTPALKRTDRNRSTRSAEASIKSNPSYYLFPHHLTLLLQSARRRRSLPSTLRFMPPNTRGPMNWPFISPSK